MKNQLEAHIDSAVADTARIAEEKDRIRAEAAALAAASLDSTATQPAAVDSLGSVAVDSLVTVPSVSDSAVVDSAGAGGAAAVDTTRAPSREQIRRDTTYPLVEAADTSGTRKPPPPSERSGQPADSSLSGTP